MAEVNHYYYGLLPYGYGYSYSYSYSYRDDQSPTPNREWSAEPTILQQWINGSIRLCLTILPLILLLTQSLDLIHANHLPQLHKPQAPE